MGFALMRPTIAVIAACAVAVATMASAAEQVDIAEGSVTLRGVLFRPEGPGPFPGVVALHGCAGLLNSQGKIVARLADWGDRPAARRVAALFPGCLPSRRLSRACPARQRRG